MTKKKITTVEDQVSHAERQWERMKDLVENGICDRNCIISAMNQLNLAHKRALDEKKRHLIR